MHTLRELIDIALKEDIGPGDITTDAIVDPAMTGKGMMTAKESFILSGLDVAAQVFTRLDPEIRVTSDFRDGDAVSRGVEIMRVNGKLRALLCGERTALNFLQRLSGIATLVNRFVQAAGDTPCRLVDTRKTTPAWRILEKQAVRAGGGGNHRMGLYDGVLIKDNHIAVAGGITNAVRCVRKAVSHLVKIEVEAATLSEVREAVACEADVIMLDNMDLAGIKAAKRIIGHRALVEVSGGVNLDNIQALAGAGVDIVSVGAFTHAARSVDISMAIEDASP